MFATSRNAELRACFPAASSAVLFDHASVGPISTRVRDAMQRVNADYCAAGYQNAWRDEIESVRSLVASLVGSASGNIAFTQNTSTGLSIAANGIDWRPGDNVVLPEREFPSNYYPWANLAHRGVEVRTVPAPHGHAEPASIAAALDDRTRAVAVSAVQFSNGHRYALDVIGAICASHGALFVVDGTQAVGALRVDAGLSGIDVLAVSSHKWMLGPSGIGFAHVSDRALDVIRPDIVGWLSVTEPFAFDYRLDLPRTADRYEPGTENIAGIIGLGAAIELFLEHGVQHVEDRVLTITDELCERLRAGGHEIVSPRTLRERSGIVIFRTPDVAPDALHQHLMASGIRCAPRGGGIRFSPHWYNDREDIDAAIEALDSFDRAAR